MYYYEGEQNRRFLSNTFLKKVLICIVIIISILVLKKLDMPLTDYVISKVKYHVFVNSYDMDDFSKAYDSVKGLKKSIPVFKQKSSNMIAPVSGKLTSEFGSRMHPILRQERAHNGIDIAQKEGTQVKCVLDGKVYSVGFDEELGNFVKIKHDNGFITVYAHLNDVYVSEQKSIRQGEEIGTVGKTGLAQNPHLHFEVWKNNTPQNPINWIDIQ